LPLNEEITLAKKQSMSFFLVLFLLFCHVPQSYGEAESAKVEKLIGKAKQCTQLELTEQTLGYLNEALSLDPDNSEALILRGEAYYQQGKVDDAYSDASRALTIDPDNDRALNNRAIQYVDIKKHDLAERDLNRAIEINPNVGQYYFNRGYNNHQRSTFKVKRRVLKKRFRSIVDDYIKAIQTDSVPARPYAQLSDLCRTSFKIAGKYVKKNYPEYRQYCMGVASFPEQVSPFDPLFKEKPWLAGAYIGGRTSAGDTYYRDHKMEKAFEELNKAIVLVPLCLENKSAVRKCSFYWNPAIILGHWYCTNLDFRQGFAYYKLADDHIHTRMIPDDYAYNYLYGTCMEGLGRFAEAQDYYRNFLAVKSAEQGYPKMVPQAKKVLATKYGAASMQLNRELLDAENLLEQGLYEQAAERFASVISQNYGIHEAHFNMGVALFKLGRKDEAIQEYSQAIKIAPQVHRYHYLRGMNYFLLNRYALAYKDLTRALKGDPYNPQYLAYHAKAAYYAGQDRETIRDLNLMHKLGGEDPMAYVYRGRACFNLGYNYQAIADLTPYIDQREKKTREGKRQPSQYDANEYVTRGIAYNNINEHEWAVADLKRAIALNPEKFQAYYVLGESLVQLGLVKEANEVFQRFLSYSFDLSEYDENAKRILDVLRKSAKAGVPYFKQEDFLKSLNSRQKE